VWLACACVLQLAHNTGHELYYSWSSARALACSAEVSALSSVVCCAQQGATASPNSATLSLRPEPQPRALFCMPRCLCFTACFTCNKQTAGGCAQGIGKAISIGFAEQGADVILVARKKENMAEVRSWLVCCMHTLRWQPGARLWRCHALGKVAAGARQVAEACKAAGSSSVELHEMDASSKESVVALASAVEGKVSVLVNNAGVLTGLGVPPLENDPDEWDTMLAVNLAAPMRLVRLLGPGMAEKGNGVIINISSVAGLDPKPLVSGYATSKWGLTGCGAGISQSLHAQG